jgi:uncharacterized membrane protein YraQ (UPF0718 family)
VIPEKDAALRRLIIGLGTAAAAVIALALVLSTSALGFETGLSIFATRFLGLFIEAAPFLILGSIASGLIDSFISPDDITRLIPKHPILGSIVGALMGFAFPVCECGVVPVVRRLYRKGLPMSVGVAFLLASPVINPIVLAGTYVAFGFTAIFIGRIAFTLIVAIAVGIIFAATARPSEVLRAPTVPLAPVMGGSGASLPKRAAAPGVTMRTASGRKPLFIGLRDALVMAGDEFFDMGRYLIVGSLLAAAMQTLVSQEVLVALGSGPILSVLVMQALAFVLSVCSTVDAFLALAFVGTFTGGSIMAFLSFGPMVDIKSTLMFIGVFRKKVVVYLVVLPFLMTLLLGVWVNLNLPV